MEQALADAQSAIEQMQGQLNVVEHQAAFSTITLTMGEVSPAEPADPSFGARMGDAMKGSFAEISGWGEGLLVWLASAWPWLLVLGLLSVPVVRWIRRRQRDHEDD